MQLKGDGFIVREYQDSDLASLCKAINSKGVARYTLRIPNPYGKKDGEEFLRHMKKQYGYKSPSHVSFAIVKDEAVIGGIGLMNIKDHKLELGYWLNEKYWGKGIMTNVVKLMVEYGFKKFKVRRIYAGALTPNVGSRRVLEKAGFTFEGVSRKSAQKGKKVYDQAMYAIVR